MTTTITILRNEGMTDDEIFELALERRLIDSAKKLLRWMIDHNKCDNLDTFKAIRIVSDLKKELK